MKFIASLFLKIFCILQLSSCARTNDVEVASAIREARYHLTTGDCSKAKDILDDVDADSDDGEFVSVMASAIACAAGYTDTKALLNLENIDATATTSFLGSFASFTTSDETSADAASYSKIKEALDYLLEADGGTSPSTINRLDKFGTSRGSDLSMQALFMGTVALGKFFAYYGNTDSVGVKGNGSGSNGCITNYLTNAQMNADLVADNGGANLWSSCDSGADGHPDLDSATLSNAVYKRRMCEGIVIFNNIADILSNLTIDLPDTNVDFTQISDLFDDIYTAAFNLASSRGWGNAGAPILSLQDVTSQSTCESFSNNDLEIFYLSTFEALLQ